MEDFLQSQIQDSCKLALPEGLKDLMSDISREVLRAQPKDLYIFIANYLGALLKAREALILASHTCKYVCDCLYHTDIDQEMKEIGLTDEDIRTVKDLIHQHVETGSVDETYDFTKLMKDTSIDASQLETVQGIIKRSFEEYKLKHPENITTEQVVYPESSPDRSPVLESAHENDAMCQGTSASALTLAGSHVELPPHRPYSVHDHDSYSLFSEKIRWTYDHTLEPVDRMNEMLSASRNSDSGITYFKDLPSNAKKIDTHFMAAIFPHLKEVKEQEEDNSVEDPDDIVSTDVSNHSLVSLTRDDLDAASLEFITKFCCND